MKKKERTHFVRGDMVPGYLDEQHDLGTQNKDRFAERRRALDANDIDDYDKLIERMYGNK